MKTGESTGWGKNSQSHLVMMFGGVEQCEMKQMVVLVAEGRAQRWVSVKRHSKEPQVAHCSPAAPPASPPPSSSSPGNRTPLKSSAWAIQREGGEGCVCVCYITKKVFDCPHTQNPPGTSFSHLYPPVVLIWETPKPIHKIPAFNVPYQEVQWLKR